MPHQIGTLPHILRLPIHLDHKGEEGIDKVVTEQVGLQPHRSLSLVHLAL